MCVDMKTRQHAASGATAATGMTAVDAHGRPPPIFSSKAGDTSQGQQHRLCSSIVICLWDAAC